MQLNLRSNTYATSIIQVHVQSSNHLDEYEEITTNKL